MKIAVIGAGAMGSIYGGHLALDNEVYLVDTNAEVVRTINEQGIRLEENGEDHIYRPKAVGFGDGVSIENCNEDVKPFHDTIC